MSRRGLDLFAAGLLLVAAAGPASADWLLMLDGSRLETKGPWEVRGSQVVFSLPNGTLAAVRASAVDFDGSARITAEARAPKPAPTPPPPRKPAVRLTDADIRHVEAPAPAAPEQAPAAAAAGAPTAPTASPGGADLEVMTWNAEYDTRTTNTVLSGTLRNNGSTLVYNIKVVVTTLDNDGKELATTEARVLANGIPPGSTGAFDVVYPGNLEIKGAKFQISAERVALSTTTEPEPTPAPAPTLVPVGSTSSTQRLRVADWHADPEAQPGSVSIIGEIVNSSADVAYDSALEVTLRGADGKDLATAQALLGLRNLNPGEKTNFRVTFPGVESFQDVVFQTKHNARQPVSRTVPVRPSRPG